jgi:hypothetical protein
VYLSYRFIMYTLLDKHVEKHTNGNVVFYGHVLSLKRVQAARLLSFIVKLCSKLTMAYRQVRRHLSEDEMNRGIGMLDAGHSQRHVTNVLGISRNVVSWMWNHFQ